MPLLTRREAMGTIITGSLTAALVDFAKGGHVMAEEVQQSGSATPQLAPAYRKPVLVSERGFAKEE